MQIISVNPKEPDREAVKRAADALARGGVIVYPTDTCYGLGADARNSRAMARISALKGGRDAAKRYSVVSRNLEHIESLTNVTDAQREILAHYLPGPYTFILVNADFAVAQTSTLGVRWPDYPVTQAIADQFGDAYITTSANLRGQGAIYAIPELKRSFLDVVDPYLWPDVVLDVGTLAGRPPSTVVNLTGEAPIVIREGGKPFVWPMSNE